jgi:site-specific DNA-methyltransferase (adenine-specific)
LSLAGLPPKGVVVWDKTAGSRPVKGGFNLQTEFILWGRKGSGAPPLHAHGVITAATLTKKQHITQKPVKVIEHILQVVPKGGKVLDPFAGVATTGVACLKNGYSFTGVEVVAEYFEIGCRRLKETEDN